MLKTFLAGCIGVTVVTIGCTFVLVLAVSAISAVSFGAETLVPLLLVNASGLAVTSMLAIFALVLWHHVEVWFNVVLVHEA